MARSRCPADGTCCCSRSSPSRCTLLPFTLALRALRHTSAFTTQLAVSLEPVYAVVLAMLLLGEQRELGRRFYVGVAVIMGAVFAHTTLKLRSASS